MISRRTLIASMVAMSAASAAFASGGPSGPVVKFQAQGKIGEVIVNPYKIAPLTAIIRDGGNTLKDVSVRIVPKKGGQEISYKVSDRHVRTYAGIPVFG
ncbi:arylsulfate sulfotransferase N-terminal domain-containing protein, partial [Sutterella massiliensis]